MTRAAAFVFILLGVGPAPVRARAGALQARFDTLIERGLKQDPLPGIAVGIVRHGRVAYARGFGVMKLGHPDEPITPRTLFHMASITKTFVATAVMQLREQGRVDLDAPVVRYLPDFRIDDPRYRRITVREMLSHSSGMPDVEDYDWAHPRLDDGALDRYVRGLAGGHLRLLFDPGTGMAYSNMAYEVLGELVAKVSGVTFEDYVQANILRPAGMTSSTLLLKDADPALLASGYMRPRGGGYASLRPVAAYPYNREHGPSSDLMSSVDDMLRWALINLNRGELDGRRILKRSTYEEMWKPAVEVEFCRAGDRTSCRKPGAWVGISWFIETKDGHPLISHSGGDDGFMTDLVLAPDADMGLVLMTNALAGGTTLPQEIVRAFYDVVKESYGGPAGHPAQRSSGASPIASVQPSLPKPTGAYAVGRRLIYVLDTSRVDPQAIRADGKREFMAVLWYPAAGSLAQPGSQWIPALWADSAASDLFIFTRRAHPTLTVPEIAGIVAATRSFARDSAPVASSRRPFPVVIFSPGNNTLPAYYATLGEELASHGYVVIGHVPTGYSHSVTLPDHRVFPRRAYHDIDPWIGDVRYLVDHVSTWNRDPRDPLHGMLDTMRIGLAGHSGGANASEVVASSDPRVRALAAIDPGLTDTSWATTKPTLILSSDWAARAARDTAVADMLQERIAFRRHLAHGFAFTVKGARHMSFPDISAIPRLQLGPGGLGQLLAARRLLVDFFDESLRGVHSSSLHASASP